MGFGNKDENNLLLWPLYDNHLQSNRLILKINEGEKFLGFHVFLVFLNLILFLSPHVFGC